MTRPRLLAAMAVVSGATVIVPTGDAGPNAQTAIYSPPVRVGGKGQVMFLPAVPSPTKRVVREALEVPDSVPRRPSADWLRGTWLSDASADDVSRVACNSGTTITYAPDGTTLFFEGSGRWSLKGDRLTETLVEISEAGDPDDAGHIGTPVTSRLRRIGPDEGAVRVSDRWLPMLRCRPGDMR